MNAKGFRLYINNEVITENIKSIRNVNTYDVITLDLDVVFINGKKATFQADVRCKDGKDKELFNQFCDLIYG